MPSVGPAPPDLLRVSSHGSLRLHVDDEGQLRVRGARGNGVPLDGGDLHWLVTVAGPTMLAALGGPIEGRGIERTTPPRGETNGR